MRDLSLISPPLHLGCLLATVLLMNGSAAAPSSGWERLAPLPVGNGGFVSGALDGEIIVAGGTTWKDDVKHWLDQIWIYDPRRNAWRETGRLPAPLAYATTGHDADKWWFAGGTDGTKTHSSLWKMERGTAPQLVKSLDRGFVYATGARIGATLYAVGGTDDSAGLERISHALIGINLQTGATKRLADYPEVGLTTATAATVADRLFVFGGAHRDETAKTVVNHSSAHVYTPATDRWSALPSLPYVVRGLTAVTLGPRHILIAGGYRNDEIEFVADAFVFDPETGKYTPTKPLPYAAMVSLVKSGDWLYCIGGEDRKKHRTDAVYRIRWRDLIPDAR